MNIIKKISANHLLILPFIVAPLLITHRFQDHTLLIKRFGVLLLFLIILLIIHNLKHLDNTVSVSNQKWLFGFSGFIIIQAIISKYNSINPTESYWELLYLTGWVIIYACFIKYSNQKTMKYIIIFSSIIGGLLSLLLFNDIFEWLSLSVPSNGSLSATFGYRNFFGQYLCFTLPASIVSLFFLTTNRLKFFLIICTILNIGGLILTRTRAAWLGILIACLIFLFLNRKFIFTKLFRLKNDKRNIFILIISLISILYFLFIPIGGQVSWDGKSSVSDTIKTLTQLKSNSSWGGRIDMYKATAKIIAENPMFGVGLGNWKLIYPKFANNTIYTDNNFTKITQRPHNDFLWLLSEVGIPTMIFILTFLIYHIKIILSALKKNLPTKDNYYIFMFCLISLIAISIESMFDFPRQRTMPNLYFWSIMGFILNTKNTNSTKNKNQNNFTLIGIPILLLITVFAFFDLKSNIYSQDAKYYNNNNMPKELYASSNIALSYYRNMDNAGTPIYYYMGIAKHQLGDKNAARVFFQKALQLAPFHIGALTNYMILLGETGELTSAHKIMSIIQYIYPKMAKSRLDMAKFYLRNGNNDKAEKILFDLKETNLDDGQGTLDKLLLHVNKK
jgi:O-antigen ligase